MDIIGTAKQMMQHQSAAAAAAAAANGIKTTTYVNYL